jgi:hypothetical protein
MVCASPQLYRRTGADIHHTWLNFPPELAPDDEVVRERFVIGVGFEPADRFHASKSGHEDHDYGGSSWIATLGADSAFFSPLASWRPV